MLPGLGQRIKHARKIIGMEQKDLAKQVGVSVGTVSRWERGISKPSKAELTAIANDTKASFWWLSDGIGPITQEEISSAIQKASTPTENQPDPTIFPPYEECSSEEGIVDWHRIIQAHDEVLAYMEMMDELGGDSSDLRRKLPRATMAVYRYIQAHSGDTPSLKEIRILLHGI